MTTRASSNPVATAQPCAVPGCVALCVCGCQTCIVHRDFVQLNTSKTCVRCGHLIKAGSWVRGERNRPKHLLPCRACLDDHTRDADRAVDCGHPDAETLP